MNGVYTFFNILFFLLIFGSILFLAAITARYFGAKASKTLQGKHLNVIETLNLGVDKKLYLVKAGNTYILLASAGKRIEMLTTLDMDGSVEDTEVQSVSPFDFKSFFDKYVQVFKNRKKGSDDPSGNNSSEADYQTDSNGDDVFRRNLDRLKRMTSAAGRSDRKDGDDYTNEE